MITRFFIIDGDFIIFIIYGRLMSITNWFLHTKRFIIVGWMEQRRTRLKNDNELFMCNESFVHWGIGNMSWEACDRFNVLFVSYDGQRKANN